MKCDELKYEKLGDMMPFYPRSTLVIRKQFVDAAIDELKREHHKERDEYIEMVAQIKAKLVEQESENRKTQRALWLARAERAKTTQLLLKNAINHLESKYKHRFDNMRLQFHVWGVVKRKCLKKAKEYK